METTNIPIGTVIKCSRQSTGEWKYMNGCGPCPDCVVPAAATPEPEKMTFVRYGDAPVAAPKAVEEKPPRWDGYNAKTTQCPTCAAKPGSPTLCARCLNRRMEEGADISFKFTEVTPAGRPAKVEPWRPSCPDDHWIPDVGEHGDRRPR